MAASIYEVAHRFANKDFGKRGALRGSSNSIIGRNYFSYSTVFGQWLDIEKNVVAIFDGETSTSSSKHKLWEGVFPDDVHVFPLDLGGGYYGWRNCNLISEYNFNDEDFKEYHRMQMIDHYVGRIYNQLAAINGGKKKGLENVYFTAWDYIEKLCSLYKDTSINKYLKWTKQRTLDDSISHKRKLVKMLKDGERDVETITDALFGAGTFKKYWDYCARFRKADESRVKVEQLCSRLGIASPYERWQRDVVLSHGLSASQIRKLSARERNELHFKAIEYKEEQAHVDERRKEYNRRARNAYKWIVGKEPEKKTFWDGSYRYMTDRDLEVCINKDTGEVYKFHDNPTSLMRAHWCDRYIRFDYESFTNAEDKKKWIEEFYEKCAEVQNNTKALSIINWAKANMKEKKRSWDEDQYILDEKLTNIGMDEESLATVTDFIARQDQYFARAEAEKRAREIAMAKREEELRKEEELQANLKKEQISECIMRGAEGCRDLWRKHYTSINQAYSKFVDIAFANEGDFYYNGNVLMRFSMNRDVIETSKNIVIDVPTCKKMFKMIRIWHEHPEKFVECKINTHYTGTYTISSFDNDILTAGCHKIAYAEMERMYNEIIAEES